MSGAIDQLYINFVSSRLERFKWIRPTVAVCRCPFCGDGLKGKRTRFYIYQDIKHSTYKYNIDCKNCGVGMSFYNFLKTYDAGLFRQYRLDNFREKYGREPREMFDEVASQTPREEQKLNCGDISGAVKLSELPEDHMAVKYVRGRKIDDKFLDYFMFTENFRELTEKYKNDADYAKRMPDDARLVIPFWDEFGDLNVYQGRSFEEDARIRYITVKKNDSVVKTFGMDRIDRSKEVRVCEGPIDSLFIKNCLASADADLTRVKGDVYIYDAQYRNPDVCKQINKAIESGVKVVLFPKEFAWKDINDAVKDGGLSSNEIESLIKGNTYQGLRAKLAFAKLRGC